MSSDPFTLRWGILATGGIAKTFTKDLLIPPSTRGAHDIHHALAAAASSTSLARASAFLSEINAPPSARPYGSYTDLVRDEAVDIIYIATPHSCHFKHTYLALAAGKHVLVEKPLTVNTAQARILLALAREKRRFFMEAVWTRFFPLTLKVQDFISSGRLGQIKRVIADLSFWKDVEAEFGTAHRMVNRQLAGGAMLDVGVYSLAWVFLVLFHLQTGEKAKPRVKSAMSLYKPTGCDEMTSVVLDFQAVFVGDKDKRGNGDAHALALTNLRVSSEPNALHPSSDPVRIQGTLGEISVAGPSYRPTSYTLIPASNAERGTLADFEFETVECEIPVGHGMFWEADECARCIRDGKLESEVMGWDESEAMMEVLDEVRRQGGLVYPEAIESTEYPLEEFGQ